MDLGYRVIECAHGNEALKLCEQHDVDLVFSNIIMPNMTGYELANKLARSRPATKLMFMSNYSEYALRQHGATAPGSTVLQKPFSTELLAKTLRGVLGTAAAR